MKLGKYEITSQLKFEPRDLWIGVYWNPVSNLVWRTLLIYICFLPTIVWKIRIAKRRSDAR